MKGGILLIPVSLLLLAHNSQGLQCYQCANTDGKVCPYDASTFTSSSHDACITWRLGNGSIILQNLVSAADECTGEKVKFWSRFIDLYYNVYGGSVNCCYGDLCNDGHSSAHTSFVQLGNKVNLPGAGFGLASSAQDFLPQPVNNGNCEKYFEKISSDEWMPDILVPLAFDRASQTKVGVFYTKLGARNNNNDHVIVRIVNRAKQNLTMYSIKMFRVGSVSIHISKLEPQRNGGGFQQQDGKKTSVNEVIDIGNEESDSFQGFWISIKNDVTISVGRIGDKLIRPMVTYSDVLREGPDEPYYFGLTTPSGTSASFGVNCDMPGLHFPDTCVTDNDCEEYPKTTCASEPLNSGLDPGTREKPFNEWMVGDTLLKSCFCKAGTVRIPESRGCYDPIRKVVTIRDGCFADHHCAHLPNTICTLDMEMVKYNMSCQCVPGHKPFEADPRTGLIEGCAPLTAEDKRTVSGCSRRFDIYGKAEWVPETIFPLVRDDARDADVGVFFISLGSESLNSNDDVAVLRLLDERKDRRKMYSIKLDRRKGKIGIYESKITRNFFFSDETDKEVASFTDYQTKTQMESGYVGFWMMYKYEEGYGGKLSVGLNGRPFSSQYAMVSWSDTSTSALPSLKYIGFTAGNAKTKIHYGSNCVLVNANTYAADQYLPFGLENSFDDTKKSALSSLAESSLEIQNPLSNPWNYLSAKNPSLAVALDPLAQAQQRPQLVPEPVLKSQYLTKLRSLLPTADNDKVLNALNSAYRSFDN